MKPLTKSFKSRAAAAVVALAVVTAGAAPAFAWGAGVPDGVYSNDTTPAPTLVRTKHHAHVYNAAPRTYYDYAAPQAYRADPPADQNTGFAVGGWW
jgi:hypothetical protein